MPTPSLLQRLKERKLVQWAIAYLCGAWVLVEATNLVVEQFSWPQVVGQIVTILAFFGFFVVLVIAWYHGEKGRQWVSGPELLIIALLLLISGGVLSMLDNGEDSPAPAADSDRIATEDEKPGVAVLPCANMSADPADEYLAASLHDEILLKLQKISSLFSIGRTSVLQYAEDPPATSVIASALSVGFVGECSVQKYGDQIRLIFQLLDGRTGSQVWAEDFDRILTVENLFDIQNDIARERFDQAIAMEPLIPWAFQGYALTLGLDEPTDPVRAGELLAEFATLYGYQTPGRLATVAEAMAGTVEARVGAVAVLEEAEKLMVLWVAFVPLSISKYRPDILEHPRFEQFLRRIRYPGPVE